MSAWTLLHLREARQELDRIIAEVEAGSEADFRAWRAFPTDLPLPD